MNLKAQKVRALVKQDFSHAFEQVEDPAQSSGVEVIVGPMSPTVPLKIGEKVDDPLNVSGGCVHVGAGAGRHLCDFDPVRPCRRPRILCGAGSPGGMQIMASAFDEPLMLQVSYAYEQATEWHERKPAL